QQIARYSFAWDGRDLDGYLSLFTPDALFEMRTRGSERPVLSHRGIDAIRAWAQAAHARLTGERAVTRAFNSGLVFDELTGDRARTRVMLFQARHEDGELTPEPAVSGVYSDEWRKTE